MMLYRLAGKAYANDTTGIGAQRYPGRWNPKGTPCLYTSASISLALLEKFVHARATEHMQDLCLLTIPVLQTQHLYIIEGAKLPTSWMEDFTYTQWLGQQILQDVSILGFVVPSAIVPSEFNVVLNPQSAHFKALRVPNALPYAIDQRLMHKLPS
ncbi:MAG: RES domain-containing protein [Bacteroidetes bacterium]|nr:MAG: RES domain-containing protein [Bacteroidota bacterium]